MASSSQTASLRLNQWMSADKPKMEDFNSDNRKIDEAVGAHLQDAMKHISENERSCWNKCIPTIGSFTGDGNNTKEIHLGFCPSFGVVFAIDQPVVRVAGSNVILFSALLGKDGSSLGISATNSGFTAAYLPTAMGGRITNLNAPDVEYQYIMFR